MVLVVVTVNILRILGSKGRDININKIIYNNRPSKKYYNNNIFIQCFI